MKKTEIVPLFQDEKPESRKALLEAACMKSEEQVVRRSYSKEELDQFRLELEQLSIDLKNKQEIAAKQISEMRLGMKVAQEAVQDRISKLRMRYEEGEKIVYLFDYQEERKMGIYDELGNIVFERPLLPHEKQTRIVDLAAKTGTHD